MKRSFPAALLAILTAPVLAQDRSLPVSLVEEGIVEIWVSDGWPVRRPDETISLGGREAETPVRIPAAYREPYLCVVDGSRNGMAVVDVRATSRYSLSPSEFTYVARVEIVGAEEATQARVTDSSRSIEVPLRGGGGVAIALASGPVSAVAGGRTGRIEAAPGKPTPPILILTSAPKAATPTSEFPVPPATVATIALVVGVVLLARRRWLSGGR